MTHLLFDDDTIEPLIPRNHARPPARHRARITLIKTIPAKRPRGGGPDGKHPDDGPSVDLAAAHRHTAVRREPVLDRSVPAGAAKPWFADFVPETAAKHD